MKRWPALLVVASMLVPFAPEASAGGRSRIYAPRGPAHYHGHHGGSDAFGIALGLIGVGIVAAALADADRHPEPVYYAPPPPPPPPRVVYLPPPPPPAYVALPAPRVVYAQPAPYPAASNSKIYGPPGSAAPAYGQPPPGPMPTYGPPAPGSAPSFAPPAPQGVPQGAPQGDPQAPQGDPQGLPEDDAQGRAEAEGPGRWVQLGGEVRFREEIQTTPAVYETRPVGATEDVAVPVFEDRRVPVYEDRNVPVTEEVSEPVYEERVDPATGAIHRAIVGERRSVRSIGTRLEQVQVGERVERIQVGTRLEHRAGGTREEKVLVKPETRRVVRIPETLPGRWVYIREGVAPAGAPANVPAAGLPDGGLAERAPR